MNEGIIPIDPIQSFRYSKLRNIKETRDGILKNLDVPFMMAIERDDERFKKYIISLKNLLRDLPNHLIIDQLETMEDIARYNPFNNIMRIGITDIGEGYEEPPTVTIEAPSGPFMGVQAKAVALIKDGKVVKIELTDNGCGYTALPKVTVSASPSGAEAKALCMAIENAL